MSASIISRPRKTRGRRSQGGRRARPPTRPFHMRLPVEIRRRLDALARASDRTASAVAVRALREWTRMQEFPGIDFRDTPAGRSAHVTGTGLTVRELRHMWAGHGRDVATLLSRFPDLSARQVEVALRYAEAYPEDIPEGWGEVPPWVRRGGA